MVVYRVSSGAQIKIAGNEGDNQDRLVTITGTPEAVGMAQYLINSRYTMCVCAWVEAGGWMGGELYGIGGYMFLYIGITLVFLYTCATSLTVYLFPPTLSLSPSPSLSLSLSLSPHTTRIHSEVNSFITIGMSLT